MMFTFHVLQSYTPEWAFLPAALAGYWVFKSRIHTLGRFMKMVYLDKKERVKAWLTRPRVAVLSVAGLLLVLVPIWPDFVEGRFVLEPAQQASIRAEVSGTVAQVTAEEGQTVAAGQPLVLLRNVQLQSAAAKANADLTVASAEANLAFLNHGDFGPAEYRREETFERNRTIADQVEFLRIRSPIAGVVATSRLHDLVGRYLEAGAPIAQVADLSTMRARIYIPEYGMQHIRIGTRVRLQAASRMLVYTSVLSSVAPVPTTPEPGIIPKDQLKGIAPPRFYLGSALLRNSGELWEGMSGTAKIFVARRSIAEFVWIFSRDLFSRKLW
jgi:putative peptide zinc metalloprotease protein